MFKFLRHKSKQIHALFTIFLLLFQNFIPLFALAPAAQAQTNVNSVSLAFDSESNQLTLSGEAAEAVKYLITYDDENDETPADAISGLAQIENNKFSADLFVGTCSTDENCVKDEITKGTLSFENTDYEASFEIKNDQLWLKEGSIFKTVNVEVGTTYVAPQNDQVTVTFTTLPENSGSLMIEEITLNEEQVAALGATSNIAYDITSDMENGSFAYDLTLPVPENIEGETKLVYAESVAELAQAQTVENEIVIGDQITAEGLDHFTVFVVTYNSRPTPFPGSFPSLGFAATSTKELGDHIRLSGTDRLLNSIEVTLTNWACENDFSFAGGVWTQLRGSTDPCQTNPGASYNHPITLNIYAVDDSGANPAVGALLTSKTINATIPFRPSWDSVNCTANGQTPTTQSPFGGKWFDPITGGCTTGYNFDLNFDFSSEALSLPNDIIVSVAYNTSNNGYAPIGQVGPYNSLNVALGTTGPNIGTDVEPDAMFWNTTHGGFYTDGGAGGVGVFRRDTTWSPYGLVTKFTMAGDEAPTVSIENPTPLENSYVRGTITGRAIATDDIGMGSYYLRFWQNGFDIAGGGTLRHGCQSAPGGTGLGTNQDVSCNYNTTLNSDGTYVFSAQFLDSKNQWGQALRTFTVDNTKPVVTLSAPISGVTVLNSNTQDLIVDATDNFALDRIVGNIYQGATLLRSTQWAVPSNSANGTHTIDLATVVAGNNPLPQGSYTLRYNAQDMAGNISETKNFNFTVDNTAPSFWIKGANWGNSYTPASVGSGNVFSKVSFKLFDSQMIDKVTINGVNKELSNNSYSDVNNVVPGVFGAVVGNNTLVVYDVAGNTTSYDFILDIDQPTVSLIFTAIGPTGTSFQAEFSESVNPADATNPPTTTSATGQELVAVVI